MKRYIAEAIGTFGLVFCGTGAIVVNEATQGAVTHPGVAITFGLIVMAMIYAFGDISGAHINPAVTFAFAYAKKFPWKDVPRYIIAQVIGGFVASLIILYVFPEPMSLGATVPETGMWRTFVIEMILTFFLMLVIINVSTGSKEVGTMAGIAVGGVVLLEAMFAGPLTGASMNPARSLAPGILSGNLEDLWIYCTAPFVGAVLAVMSCKLVKDDQCCEADC